MVQYSIIPIFMMVFFMVFFMNPIQKETDDYNGSYKLKRKNLEAKYERRYTCAEDIKPVYSLKNNDVFIKKIMKIYHDHLFLKKYSQEEISDKLEKGIENIL